ncbi:hypothetical protein O1611_g4377 [Lasiodiplodia mahajangana]|uniref:Uncharacterized protein n=1 Tax=Lasiodiplodia mahajangana TaxID=1108764 RepID=A0ACC2JP72_9PEZI|nr:hypothetical protein O1611_g4377 [Lasiodiplodia mahajangana]
MLNSRAHACRPPTTPQKRAVLAGSEALVPHSARGFARYSKPEDTVPQHYPCLCKRKADPAPGSHQQHGQVPVHIRSEAWQHGYHPSGKNRAVSARAWLPTTFIQIRHDIETQLEPSVPKLAQPDVARFRAKAGR